MSVAAIVAGLLAASQANASPSPVPNKSSARWDWRHCTRLSTDAQLRSGPLSIEADDVVQKAFSDCADLLKKVARTQSSEDLNHLKEEQSRLIKLDVEMFCFDGMTGHI